MIIISLYISSDSFFRKSNELSGGELVSTTKNENSPVVNVLYSSMKSLESKSNELATLIY